MLTKHTRVIAVLLFFVLGTVLLSSCRNGEIFLQQRYFPEHVFPIGISSNTDMFLMVTSDNRLWGHGWLSSYLVEPGIDVMRKYHPMPVHIMNDISYITVMQRHMFVITTDGSLLARGNNAHLQLGVGRRNYQTSFRRVMNNVTSVSAGARHTLAIRTDGALMAWGSNNEGQLGDGTTTNRRRPVRIMNNIASVSAGARHTLALTKNGELWGWGANENGQLGDGTTIGRSSPVYIMSYVVAVSAGNEHSMAITSDGKLWTWGCNNDGQLGSGTEESSKYPVQVKTGIAAAVASGTHSFAVTANGGLWAWGSNSNGHLGDGTHESQSTPVEIISGVTQVSTTSDGRTFAIRYDKSVWTWGRNYVGHRAFNRSNHALNSHPSEIWGTAGFSPHSNGIVGTWQMWHSSDIEMENYTAHNGHRVLEYTFYENGILIRETRQRESPVLINREYMNWKFSQGNYLTIFDDEKTNVYELLLYRVINSSGILNGITIRNDYKYSRMMRIAFVNPSNYMRAMVMAATNTLAVPFQATSLQSERLPYRFHLLGEISLPCNNGMVQY